MANKRILLISGWGQSADSLKILFPKADVIDYLSMNSLEELEQNISGSYDIVIGWSLGGQIAVYLLSSKIINTKCLTLIATAYKFPNDDFFKGFRDLFLLNPEKCLKRFSLLIAKGHNDPKKIISSLENYYSKDNLLYWLEKLVNLSIKDIDINNINLSSLLLFHGKNDNIVSIDNIYNLEKIYKSKKFILDNCGHAPHLEYSDYIINNILAFHEDI